MSKQEKLKEGIDALFEKKTEEEKEQKAVSAGRPKATPPETLTTVMVEDTMLEKIRALAYWERITQKEVFVNSLNEYLTRYEAKNGKIKPKP